MDLSPVLEDVRERRFDFSILTSSGDSRGKSRDHH